MRERNRGKDLEMIWKRFGDAKQNSQELEKKFETATPTKRRNNLNAVRLEAFGAG